MTVAETETTTSADGTAIAYERIGQGPPVIIVGGAWADRHSDAPIAQLLAARFTVYTYDRRGRGDSGNTRPYAVEREIEDLEAVIEAADGSASLFGLSSGGALAIETAAGGAPVSKLAVYEVPYIVDDSRPPLAADYIQHIEELVAAGRRREVFGYFMTEAVRMPEEMVQPMRGEPLPTRWTRSVTAPTLVMDGGNSPTWLHSAARALVSVLPDVEYQTLADQDHNVAPEAVAPELAEFLS